MTKALKPGFIRVYIPDRDRTILINQKHAKDQNYLTKHGMVVMTGDEKPKMAAIPSPKTAKEAILEAEIIALKEKLNGVKTPAKEVKDGN